MHAASSRLIDRQTPPELDLHLILDNYAAHKTEAVKRWFARHPRFHVHFTPTSASWINAVEGLFATLTKRRLRRGVFRSVIELSQAISDYLDAHNADPKPQPTPSSPSTNAGNVCWNHSTLMFASSSCRHGNSLLLRQAVQHVLYWTGQEARS
jgi:hypothetical protein